ncbi:unnamed protein product, partial [Prorocentrum cordatum]
MDCHTMMAHFREMLRSEIQEPMAEDFADVKTSIDNVCRDVERHEASSVGPPLLSSGLESAAQSVPSGPKKASDKICVTIGGWDRDTPRDTILNEARAFTDTIPDKAEDGAFVPLKRASFLKVRSTSSGRMWAWVRSMKGKHITMPQPHHQGRRCWFSVEKASEEIRRLMVIRCAKKEMIDNLGVQTADLEMDYIRGRMSFKEHVAADISAHAGAHLNVVESQAKVNAGQRLDKERTLEESEAQMVDYDAAIFQGAGYWGKIAKLGARGGDIYVTPRVEGQKQMRLLVHSRARLFLRGDLLPSRRSAAHHFRIRKKDYWIRCSHFFLGHSPSQCEGSLEQLSDLITMAPPGAYPIVGAGAQTAPPPPRAGEGRWVGGFPVGQRTRRAEISTRLLMQHDRAATNTLIAAASGPTCHCDFKHPPAQIDYVLIPARDSWKVSAALEEVTDSAQSAHSATEPELTLGTSANYIHGGRGASGSRSPWQGPASAEVPKLPESHEHMQTQRMLGARRRGTRDRVQRAIYSEDIIRTRRKIWTANRALQHGLHEAGNPRVRAPRRAQPGPARSQPMNMEGEIEDDPLRIKELLERDHGSAFRASDGEEPVGVSACPTHFTKEDVLDIPPFSPEMLREALNDMEAMKAPGVDAVVAEVLQALDSGFLASLAAVFENRFRGVPECQGPITPLTTFEKLYSIGLIKKCGGKLTLRSPQCAYQEFHQAMDVIFSMRMLMEKAREWNRPIFIVDGGGEAAFDHVSRRSVEEALRRWAVPRPVILAIMRELKASAAIKMGSAQTQPALRSRGIRQGDPASTILFNLVLGDAWEEFSGECWARGRGFEFPGEATLCEAGLLHADNFWLFAGAAETPRQMTMAWRRILRDRGWHVPPSGLAWGATTLDHEFSDYQMTVEDGILTRAPRAEGFPGLGSVFTFDGRSWKGTRRRAARAWRAFCALKLSLPGRACRWQRAAKLLERAIKPVLLSGSGSR